MTPDDVDVLIVGAGLSGIGAAVHLGRECPGRSYAILEGRDAIGGTWDLFRYPGIRSDSDMYTLGYSFRPWTDPKAIADGPDIRSYIRSTAADNDVDRHIRFGHRVVAAEWSSGDARWTVTAERTDGSGTTSVRCRFLLFCSGYYDYENPYAPDFPGAERFAGTLIHPQHWDPELDWTGKKVVVIGSGATAVTLVPAMAPAAASVTMLQRSPSYAIALPAKDPAARLFHRLLPTEAAYAAIRWFKVLTTMAHFQLSRRRPQFMRKLLRKATIKQLPEGYAVDTHFNPTYDPWDQRLCMLPDGDLFKSLSKGEAEIVTDTIATFDESGIQLSSGRHLDADIVISATGLNLLALGGAELSVDGAPVDLAEKVGYMGMMLDGVPNAALALGYTNASWTLKCDLTFEYVCRILNHMQARGYDAATPVNDDPALETEPFIDFSSGYVTRSIHKFPRQGVREPWRLHQNYVLDIRMLRRGELENGSLRFTRAGEPTASGSPVSELAGASI
jgi:cation diffusion facilitator CzcD-associated flavoprotein CzcO